MSAGPRSHDEGRTISPVAISSPVTRTLSPVARGWSISAIDAPREWISAEKAGEGKPLSYRITAQPADAV